MITQAQIRKKALALWNSGVFLKSLIRHGRKNWHGREDIFPIEVRFRTPGGKEILENFDTVRAWIRTLQKHSRENRPKGYDIAWESICHRTLGEQQLPRQILFSTPEDWLFFIQKEKEHALFLAMVAHTKETLPELLVYLAESPLKALDQASHWPELTRVCQWFKVHPWPEKYIRELDIVGVDTKFIEGRKGVLMALLPLVLAPEEYLPEITALSRHGFERKFGLKYDPPLVRLRLLDSDLVKNGFSDMSVPLWELAQWDPDVDTVFITENKINGLSFPQQKRAMVIFGLGYGVEMLPNVSWLSEKDIVYWGDIDTHGFAILSQVRSYFPKVRSMLMDRETLLDHKELWGIEDSAKRHTGDPAYLTPEEYALFDDLKQNNFGHNLRLEQERIRFSVLLDGLSKLHSRGSIILSYYRKAT